MASPAEPGQSPGSWQRARASLHRLPGARLAQVPVRVARAAAVVRRHPDAPHPNVPDVGLTAPLTGRRYVTALAVDELVLGLVSGSGRLPDRSEIDRVSGELTRLDAALTAGGWYADPAGWHRRPPVPDPLIQHRRLPGGVAYEHLRWRSGFAPDGVPGADRWATYVNNRTAHAYVLRHEQTDRPWVLCLHGLGTGVPLADFFAFRVPELHRSGFNVVLPALPRHGPRKHTRRVDEFLSHDLVEAFLGISHAVWDLRALLSWIHAVGGSRIAAHGISLGGYMASLLAGLDDDLDAVVAGVPLTDLPALFARHAPAGLRDDAASSGLLGEVTERVFRVVSPLAFAPRVPHANRAVYGGQADRMSTLLQARRLWEHWDRPSACWYAGNHVGVAFNAEARTFVDRRLHDWAGDLAT